MEENTTINFVKNNCSIEDFDNISRDEEMKDIKHEKKEDAQKECCGLAQQQQPTLPLTPPTTHSEVSIKIDEEQVEQPEEVIVPKKRTRKSTSKPAVPAKRKKTTNTVTSRSKKVTELKSEIDVEEEVHNPKVVIKDEAADNPKEDNPNLDVFNFDETDDDSEDVDQLMPPRKSPTKKKSSANKQTSASTRSKKSAADGVKKTKHAWHPDEDKILIDKIFGEMPRPPWSKIALSLKDRNPNACLVRWKTLKKRLYQNN